MLLEMLFLLVPVPIILFGRVSTTVKFALIFHSAIYKKMNPTVKFSFLKIRKSVNYKNLNSKD